MPLLELRKKIFLLFVTIAPSAVRLLSNGRTPSSSSEEEEHGLMKNADSASAKSEDVKSEVGTNKCNCFFYWFTIHERYGFKSDDLDLSQTCVINLMTLDSTLENQNSQVDLDVNTDAL